MRIENPIGKLENYNCLGYILSENIVYNKQDKMQVAKGNTLKIKKVWEWDRDQVVSDLKRSLGLLKILIIRNTKKNIYFYREFK